MARHTDFDNPSIEQRITLGQFSERIAAWPDEDWTGITNRKLRRTLQNRLNQRARRLQKKNGQSILSQDRIGGGESRSSSHSDEYDPEKLNIQGHKQRSDPQDISHGALEFAPSAIQHIHILEVDSVRTQRILQQWEAMARRQYMLGSPRTDLLLHLIQFNFTKALIENTRILGLTSENLHDDAISPFNVAGPWQYDFELSLPCSLKPTVIQRTIPHHPWLDLLPIATMRDNLILAGETYDETKLCLDMKGSESSHAEHTGIIVWKDPWDTSGWEVTESFASNWGWVIRGCWDLFRSTNAWRARRNEPPLFRIA